MKKRHRTKYKKEQVQDLEQMCAENQIDCWKKFLKIKAPAVPAALDPAEV